eukprot:Blabericola_migrator_1__323@NODE_1082_length_5496_cov_1003_158224_g741_i0_p3_GENE_NODE_1082_length_5496_cov_1003_158224_g741_i0NODE_1082_length_5496_cov_1003_158224_g741_i0_p3_ORF_typecomplete_len217_score41_93Integrin_beta/PF00362_18/3_7e13VWA/PF00092_28/0_011_NODE_1082_length_5496_cov_1003_158224_g741_i022651
MKGTQLPLMVSTLKETHPGSTFGLITFRDKPITPFGIPPTAENGFYSDYCARIDVPLSDIEALLPLAYANNPPNGGGDPAENQFHAMLGAVQSQGIAWPSGVDRAKLLVLVTDAPPHFGSDGSSMQNMTAFGGTFNEADIDGQCVTELYPEPQPVVPTQPSLSTPRLHGWSRWYTKYCQDGTWVSLLSPSLSRRLWSIVKSGIFESSSH